MAFGSALEGHPVARTLSEDSCLSHGRKGALDEEVPRTLGIPSTGDPAKWFEGWEAEGC